MLTLILQNAAAQYDVNEPMVLDGGHVMLTWNAPDCATHASGIGWSGYKFEVKYKKAGAISWLETRYTNDEYETYESDLFENGQTYRFKVRYFGPNKDCQGRYRARDLGNEYYFYFYRDMNGRAIFKAVDGNQQGLQKIHNEYADKCLYPYTYAGGSVDSVRIYQWHCTSTDPKAFDITESTIDGTDVVYLMSQTLGFCIGPKGLGYGEEIGVVNCSSPLAAYIKKDSTLPGRFLLKNWLTEQCLHANSTENGGTYMQTACNINYTKQMFYFQNF